MLESTIRVTSELIPIVHPQLAGPKDMAPNVVIRLNVQEGEKKYTEDYDNPIEAIEKLGRQRFLIKVKYWTFQSLSGGGLIATGLSLGHMLWGTKQFDPIEALWIGATLVGSLTARVAIPRYNSAAEVVRQKREAISQCIKYD